MMLRAGYNVFCQINMSDFLKSFVFFGLAISIEKIISFFLLPLYTSYFNTYEYGLIDLIQVTISVISIFSLLQLDTSLQRYYFEYEGEEKKRMLSTILISIVFLTLFLTTILILFSKQISLILFETTQYNNLIQLASFQLVFSNFTMIGFLILRYEKKNYTFLILMSIKVIISLILTILFVVVFKMGISGVFKSQLIAFAISSILLFIAVKEYLMFSFSSIIFRRSTRYALPQFPARVGSALLANANRYFIVGNLSISAIGIFSLSLKLASVVQFLEMSFVMAWAPYMHAQQGNPKHKDNFVEILLLVACLVFFIVSIFSLFSIELVKSFSSFEFADAYKYVGGLSLYFSMFIFKEIVDIGPKYTEKTKYLSYTFIASLIINLISLYFLIQPYGLYGVVYSMIVTNVFLLIMTWLISNKLYYIPHKINKFVALAVPAFTLSFCCMYVSPDFWIRLLISVVVLLFYGILFGVNLKSLLKSN